LSFLPPREKVREAEIVKRHEQDLSSFENNPPFPGGWQGFRVPRPAVGASLDIFSSGLSFRCFSHRFNPGKWGLQTALYLGLKWHYRYLSLKFFRR
jgi:hypothetical protein